MKNSILPRNLAPAVIFAAVYLGAMALVVAPRSVLGIVPAAQAAPLLLPR